MSATIDPPGPQLDEIQPASVEALVEAVRDLRRSEDARADSITARGTALAGFVGIIVTLVGAYGKTALQTAAARGRGVHSLALALLVGAFILLLASLLTTLLA